MKILTYFKQELELKGRSQKTVRSYTYHLFGFARYINKPLLEASVQDVREYILYNKLEKHLSPITCNVKLAAIQHFYRLYKPKDVFIQKIPKQKSFKKVPLVLGKEEVIRIINSTERLKHKAFLTVVYSAGLRLKEALNLQISDIQSERMAIHVRCGKGGKGRYTILAQETLRLLREYYIKTRPKLWLFQGQNENRAMCEKGVSIFLRQALIKADIKKGVTIHTFRHSFATHLLEEGTPLLAIKQLLGHKSIRTTMIYTHVTDKLMASIKSPLDKTGEGTSLSVIQGGGHV